MRVTARISTVVLSSLQLCLPAAAAPAPCPAIASFTRGISLAGAEFQSERLPGVYGRDYIYPSVKTLYYYKSRGFDIIRLPFLWERLQHRLFAELDTAELDRIKWVVNAARDRCMRVILSPHNYGRYAIDGKPTVVGTPEVPNAAFADFWTRMARAFADDPGVYAFSLMNEPHDTEHWWPAAAQAGVDAIRSRDHQRLIFAPGDHWSGAWSWSRLNGNFSVNDPDQQLIYEAHQYFDGDHSGTYRQGYEASQAYPDIGIDLVRPFVDWLHARHARGVLAEFGVPNDDPRWLEVVSRLLPWLAKQGVPWVYWAGGPWWGDYPLSAEPRGSADAPIMDVLQKYPSDPTRAGGG